MKKNRQSRPGGDRKDEKSTFSSSGLLFGTLFGLAVWLAASFILILVFSTAAYNSNDPGSMAELLGKSALILSFCLGGFTASLRAGSDRLLSGLLFTAISIGIFMLLRLIILKGCGSAADNSTAFLGASAACATACSLLPAFIGKRGRRSKDRAKKFKSRK